MNIYEYIKANELVRRKNKLAQPVNLIFAPSKQHKNKTFCGDGEKTPFYVLSELMGRWEPARQERRVDYNAGVMLGCNAFISLGSLQMRLYELLC